MSTRHRSHGSRARLRLAVTALAALAVSCPSGCQTAKGPATVSAPATGMIGQPAPYGSWATPPQGAAYPPVSSAPPLPGPATQWQGSAPAMQAAPANSWTWAQPAGAPAQVAQPFGVQPPPAGQMPPTMNAQAQQFANQMQAQPQQYANQMQATANQYQQNATAQWQQANGQAQQYANSAQQQAQQYMNSAQQQAQQAMTGAQQQAQQYMNGAQQQVTSQMPQYPPPPTNTSWNPFATSANTLPPARATPPTTVPRY